MANEVHDTVTLDPGELPLWAPGQEEEKQLFELVRDNWFTIRGVAESHQLRRVVIRARSVAEEDTAWPPPYVLYYNGTAYEIGSGGEPIPALADVLAANPPNPRSVLITVVFAEGVGGQFSCDLDDGPPGAQLACADRPPDHEATSSFLAALGTYRSQLLTGGISGIAQAYRQALGQGIETPVLLMLDLADPGARDVLRDLHPEQDPDLALSKAREAGCPFALEHCAVRQRPALAGILAKYEASAARLCLTAPPPGHLWLILLADNRMLIIPYPIDALLPVA